MNTDRYFKLLARQGIDARFEQGFWHLQAEDGACIHALFPSDGPLEVRAIEQALTFARARPPLDAQGRACAPAQVSLAPDAHPGSSGTPVGLTARAQGFWLPSAIGTDINCGMRLFVLDGLSSEELQARLPGLREPLRRAFCDAQRNLPATADDFLALFEDSPAAFARRLRNKGEGDWQWLTAEMEAFEATLDLDGVGRGSALAPPWLCDRTRASVRDPSLGTLGSGNHFLELGAVDTVSPGAHALGLRPGQATALLHTGSREVGFHVGSRLMDWAKSEWPQGLAWPAGGHFPMTGPHAREALNGLGCAARFAWANRLALGALLSRALQEGLGRPIAVRPVADCAHNMVFEEQCDCFVHRKGAQKARVGDLAIIPGSMGDRSYLARGLGSPRALESASHGAGRALSRGASVHSRTGRIPPFLTEPVSNDPQRAQEEAPRAYKDIEAVMSSQVQAGVLDSIASLRPIVSVKA